MPRPANDGLDKFQRYRAARKTNGMKLLRIWVPDPHASGFREEAQRQARLLRGAPEEREALDFIDAAASPAMVRSLIRSRSKSARWRRCRTPAAG